MEKDCCERICCAPTTFQGYGIKKNRNRKEKLKKYHRRINVPKRLSHQKYRQFTIETKNAPKTEIWQTPGHTRPNAFESHNIFDS